MSFASRLQEIQNKMFPVAMAVAQSSGASPMPFVIVVMVAASAAFITPLGYQTNLMVYGAGGSELEMDEGPRHPVLRNDVGKQSRSESLAIDLRRIPDSFSSASRAGSGEARCPTTS